jgi:hypothetical protein
MNNTTENDNRNNNNNNNNLIPQWVYEVLKYTNIKTRRDKVSVKEFMLSYFVNQEKFQISNNDSTGSCLFDSIRFCIKSREGGNSIPNKKPSNKFSDREKLEEYMEVLDEMRVQILNNLGRKTDDGIYVIKKFESPAIDYIISDIASLKTELSTRIEKNPSCTDNLSTVIKERYPSSDNELVKLIGKVNDLESYKLVAKNRNWYGDVTELLSAADLYKLNLLVITVNGGYYEPHLSDSDDYAILLYNNLHFQALYKKLDKIHHQYVFKKSELSNQVKFFWCLNKNENENLNYYL